MQDGKPGAAWFKGTTLSPATTPSWVAPPASNVTSFIFSSFVLFSFGHLRLDKGNGLIGLRPTV
jgi:hypothetical protein